MKKLYTIDDFMIAFIAALGYGYGDTIARLFGLPEWLCLVACFAIGIASEEIISKVIFSKAIQKKTINRVTAYICLFLVFVIGHYISSKYFGVSMIEGLKEEFGFAIVLPIIGFFINLFIRGLHIKKIREVYEDGKEGYVFDLEQEVIDEANLQNKSVSEESDTDLKVKTRTGVFIGEKNKKSIVYYGIPYAKPPVGELRWKAPEPLPSSDEVFEAENLGASAVQVEHKGVILKEHRQSEDCLTLNVFVGRGSKKRKKPVIVMFHYGDFSYGGSADPLIYGKNLVSEHPDIVYVSFNYRLGIFGFADFSEVPGGEAYPDALNLGVLDQIAALEWIKENISAFGGDPNKVTALGFESGATSVCMLATCEKAKGLFQKAFVFNGNPELINNIPDCSRDVVKELMEETNSSTMEDLLRLDTETLKNVSQKIWTDLSWPTYSKDLCPKNVYDSYRDGDVSAIDFVVGIPSKESKVLRSFMGNKKFKEAIELTLEEFQNTIEYYFGEYEQLFLKKEEDAKQLLTEQEKLLDKWNILSAVRCAEMLYKGGNNVHLIYWDEEPLLKDLGSGSVDMAASLLGNSEELQMYGNVLNKDLSEILQSFLCKFASGNAMKLYHNEIIGVDELYWGKFPNALIVKDEKIRCVKLENRKMKR